MKKILLFIACVTMFVGCNNTGHLAFQGIPIDGNLSEFVKKMEGKGFTTYIPGDYIVLMKGQFVNLDCEIKIYATPKTQTVYMLTINTPIKNNWKSLKNEYNKSKEVCIKKYGQPSVVEEKFSGVYLEGNGNEMQALDDYECNYSSKWEFENGYIYVGLASPGRVGFIYSDEANGTRNKKER